MNPFQSIPTKYRVAIYATIGGIAFLLIGVEQCFGLTHVGAVQVDQVLKFLTYLTIGQSVLSISNVTKAVPVPTVTPQVVGPVDLTPPEADAPEPVAPAAPASPVVDPAQAGGK